MSLTKKNVKNQEKFSRTCGFRGDSTESLNFHFKPPNIPNQWLDFRQNPLKVEKWLFLARFVIFEWSKNFPQKSGSVTVPRICPSNFWPSLGNILRGVNREKCSRTDTHTRFPGSSSTKVENWSWELINGTDFIGPHDFRSEVQNIKYNKFFLPCMCWPGILYHWYNDGSGRNISPSTY